MSYIDQKSSLMYKLMLGVQFIFFLYLNPRLISILIGSEEIFAKIILIIFLFLLNIFWFFGIHYLFLIIFSSKKISKISFQKDDFADAPLVTVCYVTKNDFQENAVRSCNEQDYRNFHVYVLDDSTEPEIMKKIDSFAEKEEKVNVIRRKDKTGFKAGNLNNALSIVPSEYRFVAVVDADEIIPESFVKDLIGFFASDDKLAFVQATNLSNPFQKTNFAKDLSLVNDIHWKYMVPARNKYGFVMFYGHGGIIRRSALEEVDGFPEIVSEDIALSVLLREKVIMGSMIIMLSVMKIRPKTI